MPEQAEPAKPDERPWWAWDGVNPFVGWAVFGLVLLVPALLVLTMLGFVVHGLSKLVGEPLPLGHDDPNRIDWGPLAVLALYGLAATVVALACYSIGRRLLSESARAH